MTREEERQQAVDDLIALLGSSHVRVDFYDSMAFNLEAGTTRMVDAAQVWEPGKTKGGNFKWVKHDGPLVSDSRLESLRTVARFLGCPSCGHPSHDSDCGEVVGYDHLNGDHECGCPGEGTKAIEALERVQAVLERIKKADVPQVGLYGQASMDAVNAIERAIRGE